MVERDFELKGKKFKLNKINAFKQFHIVRRIAPLLAELGPAMGKAFKNDKDFEKLPEKEKLAIFAEFFSPIMNGLSKLSDEDSEKVLLGLLASVEMQQGTAGWAKVATEEMLMMQDMELPTLMQIAGRAFMYNLSGFFAAAPQA